MHRNAIPRVLLRRWAGAPSVVAILALTTAWLADVAEASQPAAPVQASEASPPSSAAELMVANRPVATLRADIYGATPADRALAINERVAVIVGRGGPLAVASQPIEGGIAVVVDGHLVFRVLDGDVDAEAGETTAQAAERAVRNLQQALDELREARDSRAILRGIGVALLATLVLAVSCWLLLKGYAWTARRLTDIASRRAARLAALLGQQAAGHLGLARLVVAPVKLIAVLVGLLLVYEWLGIVLKQFPYTRPWGEALLANLLAALGEFVVKIMNAVPGLLFVLIIFLIARFFVRVLRAFFTGVEQGRVRVQWVDETTARPTGRLLSAVIWLLALVAAYPYIPGSDSEAFKGIGVFVGLMLSIGSSGVVNQAVSGLMLMYTRSFRPGEFVKVGDTEGTVRAVGFLTTEIETLRREQVTIPNAVIVGNVMRNFSRFRDAGGIRAATAITIGYDTPWRQVQAMLQLAAERTPGVMREPPPRILQTGLLDHAVEYTVLVSINEPEIRPVVLDALHANIQDVFNEHGVQIMSPRYEADPVDAKVVPPAHWFRAPAVPPAAGG